MSLDPEVRRGGNLPFGMVASRWMCDPRYSTNARTLYAILVTYADTQKRNTERGKPYRSELAAQLGVSVSTVDRTLAEMEVAGMVRVEPRVDPDNPANNDASIYHLFDYPLMYAGNGEWTDPLSAGVKAADVAKELIEQRRAEKRQRGIERRGGVPKGVNPKAVRGARKTAKNERGGSTGAARGSSMGAARVAAPVLPNIQNPLQNPYPDPEAPSARSAPDGRRPSDGSSAGAREGGSAASSKSDASRSRLSAAQWRSINEVFGYFPQGIAPPRAPELVQAILAALAEGQPDVRTPAQVGERIRSRWIGHGYAQQHADGKIQSVVGVSIDMVRAYKRGDRYGCPDPRCENGADIDTGETCRACEVRIADRLAAKRREQGQAPPGEPSAQSGAPASRPVPAQRPSALAMAECSGRDGICGRPVKNGELCSRCKTDPEHAGAADFEYASAGPAPF